MLLYLPAMGAFSTWLRLPLLYVFTGNPTPASPTWLTHPFFSAPLGGAAVGAAIIAISILILAVITTCVDLWYRIVYQTPPAEPAPAQAEQLTQYFRGQNQIMAYKILPLTFLFVLGLSLVQRTDRFFPVTISPTLDPYLDIALVSAGFLLICGSAIFLLLVARYLRPMPRPTVSRPSTTE